MCCLFGLMDFNRVLSTHQKNKILSVLSSKCEARGTDATGIAYNFGGQMRIYKRPVPAHRLHIRVPNGVDIVMGHTRMTTQGNAMYNYNNHPFLGVCDGFPFALAHNGVIWNDAALQQHLPPTHIQTDSYVAVQLLEQAETLDFSSLKDMAETVEGSFTFTVLDAEDNLYIVKGSNPFAISKYNGFVLYASTVPILEEAIAQLRLGQPNYVWEPKEGDIVQIDHAGKVTMGSFLPHNTYEHWWRSSPYYGYPLNYNCYGDYDYDYTDYIGELDDWDSLICVAKAQGVGEDEIQALFDYGCSRDEVEDLLYDPQLLHDLAAELLHAYD